MDSQGRLTPDEPVRSTTEIQTVSHRMSTPKVAGKKEGGTDNPWQVIEENGVRLRLNIVDTPGYGDQVNNDRWYLFLYSNLSELAS